MGVSISILKTVHFKTMANDFARECFFFGGWESDLDPLHRVGQTS